MKRVLTANKNATVLRTIIGFFLLCTVTLSCNKSVPEIEDASQYSADVIDKWITLQVRLMKNTTGVANNAFSRYYAYAGIAAFESLAPGTKNVFASGKWNGLSGLPVIDRSKMYFWPASVNTALACMNRNMFMNASAVDKAAIDSLESIFNSSFGASENMTSIKLSNAFGKAVADAVFNWSENDGYKKANDAFTPLPGPGLWVATPPAFAPAVTPYWGNLRAIIAGSADQTHPGAPYPYSEDPASPFYQMAKHVFDISKTLTPDQTAMALFWRDVPGVSSPGHWLSILQQVLKQTAPGLDKAAWSYAVTGTCINDALITCWQTKYQYNLVRPITYIRNVIKIADWNSLLTTPAHPEYSSAHAVLSSAAADAFTSLFGSIGSFTDHTYDYLGFAPRTFSSFHAIGQDAGNSRLYAGLHYQPSIDVGFTQGSRVTTNILGKLHLMSQ